MRKNATVGVRMAREIKEAAADAAAADRRTLSSLVEKLLAEFLLKEGYLVRDSRGKERYRMRRDPFE